MANIRTTRRTTIRLILAVSLIKPGVTCAHFDRAGLDESDIQALALRWAFQNAETNLRPPSAYCVAQTRSQDLLGTVTFEDPAPIILDRLGQSPIPVRPASACRVTGGGQYAVVDTLTGGYALLFEVGPVVATAAGASTSIAYMQGGDTGKGWECSLRTGGRGWVIDRCRTLFDI